jgi:hypothetical protein
MSIKFSVKQVEILKVIKAKRADGEYCDVYDIMDALSYKPKRDALLHSIRVLVEEGFVQRLPNVKRGPKTVRVFTVTASGFAAV